MALELTVPDQSEDAYPPLTLAACEAHQDACRDYIDFLAAQEHRRLGPGQPRSSIRLTISRGESDVIAAPRLLKEAQQRQEREPPS